MLNVDKLNGYQRDSAYKLNDETGFANGDPFESEQEVREYFTIESMTSMFGDDEAFDQADLSASADFVIEYKLHCRF